jgi:hypothetical protein
VGDAVIAVGAIVFLVVGMRPAGQGWGGSRRPVTQSSAG